ncbi:MAG TPA: PqqD family protein [bacterium]|nr:PqqD family protein [bacterium]HPS29126.1 PqqD family protein [bacterium]
MITEKSIFRIRDEVAFRKLSDGSVTIVSPVTDKMISINSSAAEIWEIIDGGNSLKQITDCFYLSHGKDAGSPSFEELKQDVVEIVKAFFDKDLIELING